jgi:hypothetical protein
MLTIQSKGIITYTHTLSDRQEEKIRNYIKDHPEEFEYLIEKEAIVKAVETLYCERDLNIYDDDETGVVESDFTFDGVSWSEFEDRSPEEIFEDWGIELE